jgi:hypothetical protein
MASAARPDEVPRSLPPGRALRPLPGPPQGPGLTRAPEARPIAGAGRRTAPAASLMTVTEDGTEGSQRDHLTYLRQGQPAVRGDPPLRVGGEPDRLTVVLPRREPRRPDPGTGPLAPRRREEVAVGGLQVTRRPPRHHDRRDPAEPLPLRGGSRPRDQRLGQLRGLREGQPRARASSRGRGPSLNTTRAQPKCRARASACAAFG